MQTFSRQLLRSVVQRIYDWAGSTLAALDLPSEPATVEPEDEFQHSLPPAHWLERVRQAAPELLQPGDSIRVRPPADTQPVKTSEPLYSPVSPLSYSSEEERSVEVHQTAPSRSHTLSERTLRLRPVVSQPVSDRISYTAISSKANSDTTLEPSLDHSAKSLTGDATQDHSGGDHSPGKPVRPSPSVRSPSNAPVGLKPLPPRFTTFSGQTTTIPSVSFRRNGLSPNHLHQRSPSLPEQESHAQLHPASEPTNFSQEPVPEIKLDGVESVFTESVANQQKEMRSPSFEKLRSSFRTSDFERQSNLFPQSVTASDRSVLDDESVFQSYPIDSLEQDVGDLFLNYSTQTPHWISLPDSYDRNGHEDNNWAFISGNRDHLQRLLKEQYGDERT